MQRDITFIAILAALACSRDLRAQPAPAIRLQQVMQQVRPTDPRIRVA